MVGRTRTVSAVFGLVLLAQIVAVTPPGFAAPTLPSPAAAPTASAGNTHERIASIAADLAALSGEIEAIQGAVSGSEAILAGSRKLIAIAKHDLGRRSRLVDERALPRATQALEAPSMAWILEPLQIVSDALHAGDQLQVSILQAQQVARQQRIVQLQLASRVRAIAFRLGQLRMELIRALIDSRREGSAVAPATTDETTAAQLLMETQSSEQTVRALYVQTLGLLVRAVGREQATIGQLRALSERVDGLNADMTAVERLVGAGYAMWFSGTPNGVPMIGGVFEVCPVGMPHAYTDTFGAPRWSGGFHLHQGNDIFAPEGTPIFAPFDGLAVTAENALGGLAVKVFGQNGYVYNAHLSEYGTLGEVTVGTTIGYVGNTGNAIHSAPHDHFEWHPGDGPAVDPYPYLNAVC